MQNLSQSEKEESTKSALNVFNCILLGIMLLGLIPEEDEGMYSIITSGVLGLLINSVLGIYFAVKRMRSLAGRSTLWFFGFLIFIPVLAVAWFFLHFTKIGG